MTGARVLHRGGSRWPARTKHRKVRITVGERVAPTVVRSWRCHWADLFRTIVGVRSTGGKHRRSGV